MPKVVPEYKAQARARIVEAARVVFLRQGFSKSTMQDVAQEVGVSKGALYLYFRNKSALLRALQVRQREAFARQLQTLLPSRRLPEALAAFFEDVRAGHPDPTVWLRLLLDAAGDPELRRLLRADMVEDLATIAEFLRERQRRGRFPAGRDPEAAAYLVILIFQATVLQGAMGRAPPDTRRALVDSLRLALER